MDAVARDQWLAIGGALADAKLRYASSGGDEKLRSTLLARQQWKAITGVLASRARAGAVVFVSLARHALGFAAPALRLARVRLDQATTNHLVARA